MSPMMRLALYVALVMWGLSGQGQGTPEACISAEAWATSAQTSDDRHPWWDVGRECARIAPWQFGWAEAHARVQRAVGRCLGDESL